MRILVTGNCQIGVYKSILSCFLPEADFSLLHNSKFERGEADLTGIDCSVHIGQSPSTIQKIQEQASVAKAVSVPNFFFSGYHPDAGQVLSTETHALVESPIGAVHSIIAFAGFMCKFSIESTISMYKEEVYYSLGYMDQYDLSKEILLSNFRDVSLNIDSLFIKWARRGCFMHTYNHPHISCLHDISILICKNHFQDLRFLDFPYYIQDELAMNLIFPCYTEIAERRSCKGSYVFKIAGKNKTIHLEDYVAKCFKEYDRVGRESMKISPPFLKKFMTFCELYGG